MNMPGSHTGSLSCLACKKTQQVRGKIVEGNKKLWAGGSDALYPPVESYCCRK